MAVTTYGVGDALAVKLWQREMAHEVRKGIEWASLIGTTSNAIVQQKTELKDTGDQVTFALRTHLVGAGKTEAETLEGNEESLTTYSDAVLVNELDHAVRVKGKDTIDAQRVPFNLREEARMALTDWFSERGSLWFFAQMSGYTGLTMTYRGVSTTMSAKYRGNNTITAPSTNRKLFANSLTTDQAVNSDSTATFNLNMIDKAKEKAMIANPRIRPIRVDGGEYYVVYLHPIQVYDMRTTTSDGQWFDIQRAALIGAKNPDDNPIFSGALGVYNQCIIRQNEDVVPGVHSTTAAEQTSVRRALFLGAQAGCFAQSSRYSKNSPYKWVEKLFNYEKELGISVQSLQGMKKTIFNSEDFGVITISTYAAAHT